MGKVSAIVVSRRAIIIFENALWTIRIALSLWNLIVLFVIFIKTQEFLPKRKIFIRLSIVFIEVIPI